MYSKEYHLLVIYVSHSHSTLLYNVMFILRSFGSLNFGNNKHMLAWDFVRLLSNDQKES